MSKTETSGVMTATEGLTVTLPSDKTPSGAHAVVMHTPAGGIAATPFSSPVACSGLTESAMPDLPSCGGVQVTSADQT